MNIHEIHLMSEAVSPITHMRGSEGNEAMLMVTPISTPEGKRLVPSLSGNAIRNRLVRDPGGRWLIDRLELKGKLTLTQLNFLIHGGNLTESTAREDTARIAEMQRLFPFLRLLGGSLPNQMLKGSLKVIGARLVCQENRPWLHMHFPHGYELPAGTLKSASQFVDGYQYTRSDGKKDVDWYNVDAHDPESASNLMITSGQQVIVGSVFLHGFAIIGGGHLELGALLHSLSIWSMEGGIIGGQSGKGHGRLDTRILGDQYPIDRQRGLIEAYQLHVDKHRVECIDWLAKVFDRKTKEDKEPKAAKASKKPATKGKAAAEPKPEPKPENLFEGVDGDA